MNKQITYTASQARDNLYSLIKDTALGIKTPRITLKGQNPVVMISQEEYDSWMETIDIMSSPEETRAIRESIKDDELIDLEDAIKSLDL